MNKKIVVFTAAALFAGFILGFIFANSLNKSAVQSAQTTNSNSAFPPGHPEFSGSGETSPQPPMQAVIEKAQAEPDNFEAQIKAAALYYQIQRFEEAIEFLKKANRLQPEDYPTIVNLGNAYFDAGQYEESARWYSSAIAKKADDANVRTDLGLTFLLRQPPDYDRAVQEFTRALEREPKHPQALQNLTIAHTKKGDAAKAKETLARLENLSADNPALSRLREDIQKLETK